ncbi:MAG TPA: TPM domain-containing protein [Allocoleopsis sp.]
MFYVALIAKQAIGQWVIWAVSLCLTFILFPLPTYALTVQDVPNPRQASGSWVSDVAQLLSSDTEAQLNQIISELERQTGDEITVVTVPETTPASSPKAFTSKLFNYWTIGRNGVLFLVSKSDRRIEIQTGYGIEAVLPATQVSEIIQKEILTQFRQDNVEGGILAGTQALAVKLGANLASLSELTVATKTATNSDRTSGFVALGILLIAALVVPSLWWFSSINRRSGFIDSSSGEISAGGE